LALCSRAAENVGLGFVCARLKDPSTARTNKSLQHTESYLAEAQRPGRTGSRAFNVTTREIVHWSQEHFRMFDFDLEDGMPSFEALFRQVHSDDRTRTSELMETG
jgi:hypothetical protein